MSESNPRLGILLMIATTFVFATQDGISRYLAGTYNVPTIVMIRYWFFAVFVVALAAARGGGIARVARTSQPFLHIVRGVLLVGEIWVTVLAFTLLGLIETHAIFASYPLIIAALSGPVLGERVGWRRWSAIAAGFVGVLVILRPGIRVFSPEALIPLVAAAGFAAYGLLTRLAARRDRAETSFFWTGVSGAAAITVIGPFLWQPPQGSDWWWMASLCLSSASGHYLLIKAYEVAEASSVQPFAYLQLVFAAGYGIAVFGETLAAWTILGAAITVFAGVYTLWRERQPQ